MKTSHKFLLVTILFNIFVWQNSFCCKETISSLEELISYIKSLNEFTSNAKIEEKNKDKLKEQMIFFTKQVELRNKHKDRIIKIKLNNGATILIYQNKIVINNDGKTLKTIRTSNRGFKYISNATKKNKKGEEKTEVITLTYKLDTDPSEEHESEIKIFSNQNITILITDLDIVCITPNEVFCEYKGKLINKSDLIYIHDVLLSQDGKTIIFLLAPINDDTRYSNKREEYDKEWTSGYFAWIYSSKLFNRKDNCFKDVYRCWNVQTAEALNKNIFLCKFGSKDQIKQRYFEPYTIMNVS